MISTRFLGSVALALVVSGCSLLQPPPEHSSGPAEPIWPEVLDAPITAHSWDRTDKSRTVFGQTQVIRSRDSDTFSDIARTYGLGYDELKYANPQVDPWLPGVDTEIVLPTRFVLPEASHEGIVLNIAAKRLYVFSEASDQHPVNVTTYPIGIGRVGWATPTGEATVIAKAKDPAWYVPASVRKEHREAGDPLPAVVPPGPDNPLGRHVLKLDMPGYLLHGTNQPYGVGMRVSHGCVRLYPEDIETLYSDTPRGTPVTIVNQPVVVGWFDNQLWMTAYPLLEDDDRTEAELLAETLAYLADRHGIALDESGAEAISEVISASSGIPVRLQQSEWLVDTAVPVENVAAPPADAPSREEVAELLDALMQESDEGADSGAP
ncbi:MAG: L,D-transpeptidase family protein [Pseudomonadota bacterium]